MKQLEVDISTTEKAVAIAIQQNNSESFATLGTLKQREGRLKQIFSEGKAMKFSSRHQGSVATIGWKPSLNSADCSPSMDDAAASLSTSLSAAVAEDRRLPSSRYGFGCK